ncbi:unnamed protein product [Cercopithifilaria johnstoni]|uniref:Uncharacterized protein n=1 Tax=Cercopithifilaria johnstoni TaxID=2874296 RepID=A0A8J2Q8V6_9BILA|nr:unnamed protein product [Cercopithifilaria johnstoni]
MCFSFGDTISFLWMSPRSKIHVCLDSTFIITAEIDEKLDEQQVVVDLLPHTSLYKLAPESQDSATKMLAVQKEWNENDNIVRQNREMMRKSLVTVRQLNPAHMEQILEAIKNPPNIFARNFSS